MKKVLLISALLILVITSCKKEPTSANLTKVVVTDFPADDDGSEWDAGSGPDLYINIAVNSTVIWSSSTYHTDAVNTTDYTFSPSPKVLVSDLTQDIQIDFYDHEESGPDQWMGGVIFQLEDYKEDAPNSKDLTSGTFDITIDIDWISG